MLTPQNQYFNLEGQYEADQKAMGEGSGVQKRKRITQTTSELGRRRASPHHRIEGGYNSPSIERLAKISEALDVPIKDFFDFMHLNTPEERVKEIDELVKGMSEEYQQIIYKVVQAFKK